MDTVRNVLDDAGELVDAFLPTVASSDIILEERRGSLSIDKWDVDDMAEWTVYAADRSSHTMLYLLGEDADGYRLWMGEPGEPLTEAQVTSLDDDGNELSYTFCHGIRIPGTRLRLPSGGETGRIQFPEDDDPTVVYETITRQEPLHQDRERTHQLHPYPAQE